MKEELFQLVFRRRVLFGATCLGLIFLITNFLNYHLFEIVHHLIFSGPLNAYTFDFNFLKGIKVLGPPAAVAGTALFCLAIELKHFGWKDSALRRLLKAETPSTKTDIFYLLLSLSGLRPLMAFCFSLGLGYGLGSWLEHKFSMAILADQSFGISLLAAFAVETFLFYWVHRLMHSPWFWEIHKVHHSAEELNVITPHRNHPLDFTVDMILSALPLGILGARIEVIVTYAALNAMYQQLVHSKINWPKAFNAIFITPQSHRIHHSKDSRHFNKNFGVITFWDWLFGTYHPPKEECLEIGLDGETIHNSGNPLKEMWSVYTHWFWSLVGTWKLKFNL